MNKAKIKIYERIIKLDACILTIIGFFSWGIGSRFRSRAFHMERVTSYVVAHYTVIDVTAQHSLAVDIIPV